MKILKFSILVLLLVLLIFPGVQRRFNLFRLEPLKGSFQFTSKPAYSFNSLVSGKYQDELSQYVEDSVGFKNCFVRLYNQVDYSLFGKLHAKLAVVGKDGYLFEDNYIRSYMGNDYTGEAMIREKIRMLEKVNLILNRHNVHLILIFSPSKARFMPEKLPENYLRNGKSISNYEVYEKILREEYPALPFIDFNRYFLRMKDTSRYTLYPLGGTHWSIYSAYVLITDSLVKYMEATAGRKMPELKVEKVTVTDNSMYPDDDIALGMNLIFRYPSLPMAYPNFKAQPAEGLWRPNVLVISDSYYWQIYYSKVLARSFNRNDFWYYNRQRYPENYYRGKENDTEFLKYNLLKHDFVILMATEINLPALFDFPEYLLLMLDPGNKALQQRKADKEKRIREFEIQIKGNMEWMKTIEQKAALNKITVDEQVRQDAEYLVDLEIQRNQKK
jgi:hypothetical protein